MMFALPSDTENSDTEQDDGACEELNALSVSSDDARKKSEPKLTSDHRQSRRQSSADMTTAVDSSKSTDETTVMDTVEPNYSSAETVVYADSDYIWCIVRLTSLVLCLNLTKDTHAQIHCLILSQRNLNPVSLGRSNVMSINGNEM